jgi:hypothetical protein
MNRDVQAEWVFFRNILGHWCWEKRVSQRTVAESRRSFEHRDDCIADAVRAGLDAPVDGNRHPPQTSQSAQDRERSA